MCDEAKLRSWAKDAVTRREFGVLTGVAALAACSSPETTASSAEDVAGLALTESAVTFDTPDGKVDAFFVHPEDGAYPAVIFWPDIASLRESKRNMARRLAGEGHAVLVLNPYYRDVSGEQFESFAAFIEADGFEKVGPWRAKLDAEAIGRDASSAVDWLDAQGAVDSDQGIGTEGYCMGGPFTVWSAAAVPERIKAAASFHGGGLVRDDIDMSPHKILEQTQASFLIAIAQDDDAEEPDDKTALREAADNAGRDAAITVYQGDHGWTVPDSPAYAEPAAEQAYADKLELYRAAL